MTLSFPVAKQIRNIVVRRLTPVLVLLDGQCGIVSLQGDAAAYGFARISIGGDARDVFPWLHGLSLGDSFELSFVETPNGCAVDVHLFAAGTLTGVLMTDASDARDSLRRIQQQANEISLLNQRQEKLLTKLEAARAELEQRHRQSEEANQIKSRFIAGLSHEFRTPLASILGQMDLLKDQNSADVEGLNAIETNATHLLSLIDNILDQAKIESGQLELAPTPTDLQGLAEEVRAIFIPIALKRRLQLRIETMGLENRLFDIDVTRLRQVLINLLGNAVKFTREGFVVLSMSALADRLAVTVSDTGPGVSPEAKSRIFQAFHQEAANSTEGIGLGLAISSQLVRHMGGALDVADGEQGGSVFSFRIPAPSAVLPVRQVVDRSRRILVADDSDDLRRLVVRYLEQGGHSIVEAHDGAGVLSLVDSEAPDMLITDLYLGEDDGAELVVQLRRHGYQGRILVLSASSLREDRHRVLAAGADAYLVKPVRGDALRSKIAELG